MLTALLVSLSLAAPPAKKPAPKPPAPAPVTPAPEAETDEVKQARELFQTAQKLYKQQKYDLAVLKFEQAFALRPHPAIYFNIGKCYEMLGDIPKAMRAYREYLRLSPEAKDRGQVSDSLTVLERRLRDRGQQQLMVFADPPSSRISVDGRELGGSPASVELSAGNHTLTVTAEGFEPYERSFVMQTARATEMSIALRPHVAPADVPKADSVTDLSLRTPPPPLVVTEPAPAPKKSGRVWSYVIGGVAVASAGAGLGMGLVADNASKEMLATEHGPQDVQQLHDQARDLGLGATVAYSVAGAALVTAVILFIAEK